MFNLVTGLLMRPYRVLVSLGTELDLDTLGAGDGAGGSGVAGNEVSSIELFSGLSGDTGECHWEPFEMYSCPSWNER